MLLKRTYLVSVPVPCWPTSVFSETKTVKEQIKGILAVNKCCISLSTCTSCILVSTHMVVEELLLRLLYVEHHGNIDGVLTFAIRHILFNEDDVVCCCVRGTDQLGTAVTAFH